MESKKDMYRILAYAAYIISGITTLMFLVGFGVEFKDKVIGALITVAFELSKPALFIQIFKHHRKSIWTGIFITWTILEIASISAGATYMINQNNKAYESSPAYAALKEKEQLLKSNIETNKKLLETATNNLESATQSDKQSQESNQKQVADYNKTIASLNKDLNAKNAELQEAINKNSKTPMTNTINRLKGQIDDIKKQIDSNTKARDGLHGSSNVQSTKEVIDNLNNQIKSDTDALMSVDYGSIRTDKNSTGYSGFFSPIAGLVGIDADLLAWIFFFIVFGITPELLGNLFYYLYQKESEEMAMGISPRLDGDRFIPDNSIENNGSSGNNHIGKMDANTNQLQQEQYEKRINDLELVLKALLQKDEPKVAGFRYEPESKDTNDRISSIASNLEINDINNGETQSKSKCIGISEKNARIFDNIKIDGIDSDIVKKYIDTMLSTIKGNNQLRGYRTISEIIDIDKEVGRKIKNYLEVSGYIESKGLHSYLKV